MITFRSEEWRIIKEVVEVRLSRPYNVDLMTTQQRTDLLNSQEDGRILARLLLRSSNTPVFIMAPSYRMASEIARSLRLCKSQYQYISEAYQMQRASKCVVINMQIPSRNSRYDDEKRVVLDLIRANAKSHEIDLWNISEY